MIAVRSRCARSDHEGDQLAMHVDDCCTVQLAPVPVVVAELWPLHAIAMVKLPGIWGYDLDTTPGGPLSGVAGQTFEEGPQKHRRLTLPNDSMPKRSHYLQIQVHGSWFMITSPPIKVTITILSHTSNHQQSPLAFGSRGWPHLPKRRTPGVPSRTSSTPC